MTQLTIEEIADLAAVSRSTVSRVLNNHPSVRPLVRARVQQVIQEHRYTPRAAARSLASRRTNVVGLLIPRSAATIFADPFFPHVIQGITEACSNRGYFLMLSMVTVEREQDFYERVLRGRHVDGLLLMSSDIDDPILPLLIRDETPLVLVGRHPYLPDVTSVDVDNVGGAVQAVRHLLDLGHRRIGDHHRAAVYGRRPGSARRLQAGVGRGGHPDSTRVDRRRRLLPGQRLSGHAHAVGAGRAPVGGVRRQRHDGGRRVARPARSWHRRTWGRSAWSVSTTFRWHPSSPRRSRPCTSRCMSSARPRPTC